MKTYYCNASMRTNLDSARTRVLNAYYDFIYGEIDHFDYLGKRYTKSEIFDLLDEMTDLEEKANFGKVTGKEYGRIKEIQAEMQMHRYMRCVDSGMDENRASCSFDI